MFKRRAFNSLMEWASEDRRKPLILRGARQVGKTTLVRLLAEEFEQYIYLNLEQREDKNLFSDFDSTNDLIDRIFYLKNKNRGKRTLIFIDEIQEEPKAIHQLRYFFEEAPELYVIAAGSLLETVFDNQISFPVGRVEFLKINPCTFTEFLGAIGEEIALQKLNTELPLPEYAHSKLANLYEHYTIIGGMPEIVGKYAKTKSFTGLRKIYESLLVSYIDDIEKYAENNKQVQIIRHCIQTAFKISGERITFQGFGNSNYGSREIGEALRSIEKAMIIKLIYPTTNTKLPIQGDLRKKPKLQVLDVGLMNYFMGLQQDLILKKNFHDDFRGKIAEQLIGQLLDDTKESYLNNLHFWVREKKESSAEVDFAYPYQNKVIPIEVKSGPSGKLKSLALFMDQVDHQIAVRFYNDKIRIDQAKSAQGKPYFLLSLPHYLVEKLDDYLDWMQKQINFD